MYLIDVETDLAESIKSVTPEFAKSLKRRFTNVGISEEIRTEQLARPSIIFEDVSFSDDRSQITLKNLQTQKQPIARMNEIIPNLLEKNLKISVDWYNVVMKGSYDITNTSRLLPMPVQNCGDIIINLETIKATGLVGFAISRDALKTTNFDLEFNVDDIDIMIEYYDCESKSITKSSTIRKNIDHTFAKYLKRDLFWKLQETLRTRLNHVLLDFSVVEIFNDDIKMSEKYVDRGSILDNFLNSFVDELLVNAKDLIAPRYATLSIPDFQRTFSKKFGLITFWGAFEASNGTVYDLSRIKRTADFSFSTDTIKDELTIFGSIGIDELKLHYNRFHAHVWNIGPWGDLKASINDNSLSFKVIVQVKDILKFDFILKKIDLKIVQFENIKIEATGMSVILDWLMSNIVTWTTGYFKQEIIQNIEKELTIFLNKSLPNKC